MGEVKNMLAECRLNDREKHNSRLFVDLCENIHIHYREYRFVFSLPEYFEFIDVISKSTEDVYNYLRKNDDYEEQEYKTTVFIASGRERQSRFLQNSPEPNRSEYFNHDLRIELQKENVIDELHIHYRDFRLALNRENFKHVANAVSEALVNLEHIEKSTGYSRCEHPDRLIDDWSQSSNIAQCNTGVMGISSITINKIKSYWHKDIVLDWNPNKRAIEIIKESINRGSKICPVVLTKCQNNSYFIIDGHHRVRAALELNISHIDAVVSDLSWEESEPIRRAELNLKEFDLATDYRYNLSDYFKSYIAFSTNNYYRNHYKNLLFPSGLYKLTNSIKHFIKRLPLPPTVKNYLITVYRKYAK